MRGKVSRKIDEKRFGFIVSSENNQDYFFHQSSIQGGLTWDQIKEGQAVDFEPGEGQKGLRAESVRVL